MQMYARERAGQEDVRQSCIKLSKQIVCERIDGLIALLIIPPLKVCQDYNDAYPTDREFWERQSWPQSW